MQIYREALLYGEAIGITVQAMIGGAASKRQLEKLKLRPQLIVGTPGRILEMIKNRKLNMQGVRTITVDEVDQMFKLGAAGDTEAIFKSALRDRQLLFFSATMPKEVRDIAAEYMQEPEEIGIVPEQKTSSTIEHYYFETEERDKLDMLRRVVRLYKPTSAIVFVNEIESIAEWVSKLQYIGLSVEPLYGEANKQERALTLQRFREGKFQLLLATDVAARGLDVKALPMVINFDLPISSEHYVHRVGRTGRMGQPGIAISITTPREHFIIEKFNKQLNIQIVPQAMYRGNLFQGEPVNRSSSRRPTSTAPSNGKFISDKEKTTSTGNFRHGQNRQNPSILARKSGPKKSK